MVMPLRRKAAFACLAILFVPVLSSCGFDYATNREYTPSVGANNRDGQVDVLNAVIVAPEDGSGVFIASLSNNSVTEDASFDEISSEAGLTFEGLTPIALAPSGFVNLADPASETVIAATGEFALGDFVPVTLTFGNGEAISLKVPVVGNCGVFAEIPGLPAGAERCLEEPTEETH